MSLTPGSRLGVYEITAQIGEGGMGAVYRATDTTLSRQVAIKILPEAFAADPDRLARFEREAKTLASLNHPHIAAIYGFEKSSGLHALVMELVEGDDLSQRIKKGAIPFDEALPIAKQIAEALEAAHEQGIIHRDLKPANIKVRPDGTVKVLDFGLAKAMAPAAASSPEAMNSPTITSPAMTQAGMILGTAAYMAPEQAKGKIVDKRADIWAFGAVLFEMLTGQRAFPGEDLTDTLAAVVRVEPNWTAVPATVPAAVVTVMRRCLQKDRKQRVRDIGDVSLALEGAFETTAALSGASERPRSRPLWREVAAWGLAIAGLVAAGLAAWRSPAISSAPPASRFSLTLDASEAALTSSGGVSPDGQAIVIQVAPAKDTRLRLRRLDATDTVPLAGTENGSSPFWSPDSRSIGFVADRTLKRFDLATSSVRPIATVAQPFRTPVWGRDGTILLTMLGQPLHRLSENGGTPEPMGAFDNAANEVAQVQPVFLPDGRRFLYQSLRGAALASVVVLGSLDSDTRVMLDVPDTSIVWAGEDRLIFRRADALYVQGIRYDPLALVGEATQLVAEVGGVLLQGRSESASATGTLVFSEPSNRLVQFRWYGRDGRPQATVGEAGRYGRYPTFDLSPDGRRIVTARPSGSSAVGQNLWQIDADQGTVARITVGATDTDPRWSADGTTVIFGSTRDNSRGPFRAGVAADTPVPVWKGDGRSFAMDDWSRDGKWLLFHEPGVPVLMARQMDASGTPAGEPVVAARTLSGIVDQAQMSPDGKWIAYNANESGRYEVYVTPFPPTGQRYSVSRAGGSQPTWRADGGELYYLTAEGALNAVKVLVSGGTFNTSDPVELVRPRLGSVSPSLEQYAPHPSGTKFLFLETAGDEQSLSLGVLLNWPSLVPGGR